jgi:carbamate kinase
MSGVETATARAARAGARLRAAAGARPQPAVSRRPRRAGPMTRLPLTVVALGGNALSPPGGVLALAEERRRIAGAAVELAALARPGARLLVVHGNGPQVGRLLAAPGLGDPEQLDVHVAQTQGELGYLLADALDAALGRARTAALVTRVLVAPDDPAFGAPAKPVGAVLPERPRDLPAALTPDGGGWRRVVASPRPTAVIEERAIASLLGAHHVIAGGGGGVALVGESDAHVPCPAVVDKDWVASLLARRLDAAGLVFVTDVSHAFEGFGALDARPLARLGPAEARARLARGVFAPGSMAPKVEAAVEFAEATGRAALIAPLGGVEAALRGAGGTRIVPA